ncbi:ECSCR [Cervus elaphus hippelaphus]|uniref:ECSCR n=1 Tax=Cervus elaphus hippelaphus TaxID=46360 RepID=A0A212D063_CEREH|nr:ECSCR [Cervus elaphus hippelaphus]
MGSIGETQLRWAILSFLLLQGVISFIAILVVVVIVLVSVVSLRFKCQKNKESEGSLKATLGPNGFDDDATAL